MIIYPELHNLIVLQCQERYYQNLSRHSILLANYHTTFRKYNKICSLPGFTAYKTPTSVLTRKKPDGQHEFLNFGFEAEDDYLKRLKGDDAENTCLFENFKMKLHDEVYF